MSSAPLTGWAIWVQDGEHYRQFSVAEPDKAQAEALALARAPGSTVVSGNVLPNGVMRFLNATRGQTLEWFSGEPGGEIEPPPVRIEKMKNADRT